MNITRFCLWMGENLWLASWSDDSKTLQFNLDARNRSAYTNSTSTNGTDEVILDEIIPVKTRLSVYSVLGLSQVTFHIIWIIFSSAWAIFRNVTLLMFLIIFYLNPKKLFLLFRNRYLLQKLVFGLENGFIWIWFLLWFSSQFHFTIKHQPGEY